MGALLATMTLGGLWHGAGLTVAWGAAHGLGLCAGLLWRRAGRKMPAAIGFSLTFLFVMLAWVLFRAPTFEAASESMRGCSARRVRTRLQVAGDRRGGRFPTISPTAWALVHKVPPRRSLAVAFALSS